MEEQIAETKEMLVRINLFMTEDWTASTYVVITGIPKDLPVEYEQTVIKTAERQFAQALNTQKFLEIYPRDTLPTEHKPTFINLERLDSIAILGIEKVY